METVICYICGAESDVWRSNLLEVKSQHSHSPITFFINKFLGGFESQRNVIDTTNNICMGCLQRIDEYDLSCVIAEQIEKELHEILLKTEILYINQKSTSEPDVSKTSIDEKSSSEPEVTNEMLLAELIGVSESGAIGSDDESEKKGIKCDRDFALDVKSENEEEDSDSDDDYTPSGQSKRRKRRTNHPKKRNENTFNEIDSVNDSTDRLHRTVKKIAKKRGRPKVRTDEPILDKNRKSGRPPGSHDCAECDEKFTTKRDLNAHIKWHKKQRVPEFKCQICFYVLADQNSYDEHLKLHENVPPLECVFCRKVFTQRGNMHLHMKIHVGTPNHQCDLCGKTFVHSTSFEAHMKYHLNIREICCPQAGCDKRFVTTSHLYRHLQSHKKDKPYSCSICGNRFGYITNMRAHEKMHTQTDKTHICSFCGAAFARKSKLNQHLQKNHATMLPHSAIENDLQTNGNDGNGLVDEHGMTTQSTAV